MLIHQISLDKLERTEILQSIFSDHNGIKLEISNNKISKKTPHVYKQLTYLKQTNKQWIKEKITKKIRKAFEQNENENVTYENLWALIKAMFRKKFRVLHTYIGKSKALKSLT